jgi:hypothetical protein
MRESGSVETATQTLHRLTSYEPGQEWDAPVDDPRVVRDLEVNDMSRLPWFWKRYERPLPRLSLPRDLPGTTAPAVGVLAGTAEVGRTALDLAQLSRLLYLSAVPRGRVGWRPIPAGTVRRDAGGPSAAGGCPGAGRGALV